MARAAEDGEGPDAEVGVAVKRGAGSGKRRGAGRARKETVRVVAALPAVPEKYAALTVYDPHAKEVVHADGTRMKRGAPPTLAELSQVPAPLAELDKLHACETASRADIERLAKVAGTTVSDLEYRRHHWSRTPEPTPLCWELPPDRRRCLKCPYWTMHSEATPF